MHNLLKDELFNIISGKSQISNGTIIQTIASYLKHGSQTSIEIENSKQVKEQETKKLEAFVSQYQLWISNVDFSQYISEGAEQRVYLKDSDYVLKLNDSIYYSSWTDYFHNLLLHNFFFPDTSYELMGFIKENEVLYAVVKQSFVTITQETELTKVKEFLESNGFQNNRNNDYINYDLGIILEDLHDENVLTKDGILYFIDTVFYLTKSFWEHE